MFIDKDSSEYVLIYCFFDVFAAVVVLRFVCVSVVVLIFCSEELVEVVLDDSAICVISVVLCSVDSFVTDVTISLVSVWEEYGSGHKKSPAEPTGDKKHKILISGNTNLFSIGFRCIGIKSFLFRFALCFGFLRFHFLYGFNAQNNETVQRPQKGVYINPDHAAQFDHNEAG